MARERFEKYHAEGVKIRALVDFRACRMFRRSIIKRPQGYRARRCARVARLVLGVFETGERDFAVFAHHEIFRFQVTVNDSLAMDLGERGCRLGEQRQRPTIAASCTNRCKGRWSSPGRLCRILIATFFPSRSRSAKYTIVPSASPSLPTTL